MMRVARCSRSTAPLAISVALIFGLLAIGSHAAWFSWLKVGIGVALVVEGFLLARDWRGARGLAARAARPRPRATAGIAAAAACG